MAAVDELERMLATHPQAWVGAIGPDSLYVPMPASVPVGREHRHLGGRWALDLVAAGDRAPVSEVWRSLLSAGGGHGAITVRLVTGVSAELHLFKTEDVLGADVLVVLTDAGVDLSTAPAVHDLVLSSRFTQVLRDQVGRPVEVDAAAPELLGWSEEELLSRTPPLDRVHPDDRDHVLESWMATLAEPATGHRTRARLLRKDGTYRWFEITNFNRLDDPDKPCVVSEFLDVSEEMAAHEAVRAREQLLHRLAEALPLGVLQVDADGRVVYRNDYLTSLVGGAGAVTVVEQFALVVDEDLAVLAQAFDAAIADGVDGDVVVRIVPERQTTERIIRVITKSLHADGGQHGVIACISDVTETELMGRELERRATFDALTSCLNRASILARLDDALAPGSGGTAVIFLDLDGFKEINDRLGHAVGDDVLRAVAQALASSTRQDDAVGRLGGDEFLVVCTDIAGQAEAMDLAERVSAAIRAHPGVPGTDLPVRASIGVAWAGRGSVTADELVERADAAMYESKRVGAGRPHLWSAGPQAATG